MSSKRALLVAAALFLSMTAIASAARADRDPGPAPDTLLLKNGGRLRGSVIEEDPKRGVTIRLLDGTTRKVPASTVDHVEYATAVPATSTPTGPAPVAETGASPEVSADTVFLKNGSKLRGSVVQEEPKRGVSILLLDGTTRKVASKDVDHVEYAPPRAPVAPPAPPATNPPVVVAEAAPTDGASSETEEDSTSRAGHFITEANFGIGPFVYFQKFSGGGGGSDTWNGILFTAAVSGVYYVSNVVGLGGEIAYQEAISPSSDDFGGGTSDGHGGRVDLLLAIHPVTPFRLMIGAGFAGNGSSGSWGGVGPSGTFAGEFLIRLGASGSYLGLGARAEVVDMFALGGSGKQDSNSPFITGQGTLSFGWSFPPLK